MDLKNLFNEYLVFGIDVRLSRNKDGKKEWNNKISKQDNSQNPISGGWVTPRTLNDGLKSSDANQIYNYVHNTLGMKGETNEENKDDDSNKEIFLPFHFLLQTARQVKNKLCNYESRAQIAFNVGQVLASIDFYKTIPNVFQYIINNNLYLIDSYVDITVKEAAPVDGSKTFVGGSKAPVFDIYKKYINLTPYKGSNLFGGSCQDPCKCGSTKCNQCQGSSFVNLMV